MKMLALEMSSQFGSAALFEDGTHVAECSWEDERFRKTLLFDNVRELMAGRGLGLETVTNYAVGVGPGSFTGLRTSISAACGFALPGQCRVYAVSSGEALADRLLEQNKGRMLAVLGDARRERLWLNVFGQGSDEHAEWTLVPAHDLAARLPAECVVASPDWHRLGDLLRAQCNGPAALVEQRCIPTARDVGALALKKETAGVQSLPLTPIYMHPAVAGRVPDKGEKS